MTPWLAITAGLLSLVRSLLEARANARGADRERAALMLEWQEAAREAVERGESARDRVRLDILRDPRRLRTDDGFKRRDTRGDPRA